MIAAYVWRDLIRNPRRTLSTLAGVALGVGLFASVLFFIDGSSASMTQRALAPLPIDMQRVLTTPVAQGVRLTEIRSAPAAVGSRDVVTIRLEVVNDGSVPANEVVLRSEPPPGLTYAPGTTKLDGLVLRDVDGHSPLAQGPARTGFNLGTVPPGGTVAVSYGAAGNLDATDGAAVHSSFSSREAVTPVPANAPAEVPLGELATLIAQVEGVSHADELSFVDLAPGSLSTPTSSTTGPARVFGFAPTYARRYSDITIVEGAQEEGSALLSVEAARELGVGIGDTVDVAAPGRQAPMSVRVSGTADLSRARSLFFSRQGANLEEFVYVQDSVVIDPETFDARVLPAFQIATTTRGDAVRSVPVREVDIGIDRARLHADPATALSQAAPVAEAVNRIAGTQDFLIDNVSNTLHVARADAAVAKRMFVFLGVPGIMLAAVLASYAGGVLAGAQRREQATLRIRGANQRHLLTMLGLRTLLITAVGSVVGVALGVVSAALVLGTDALARSSASQLMQSAAIGTIGGFLATGSALYLAGRRSISRDINEDRARLSSVQPLWRRARLDLLVLVVVTGLTAAAAMSDAFAGASGSVYEGRAVELRLALLVLPIAAWIGATLLLGRGFSSLVGRMPVGATPPFSRLVWGVLTRSVRRRGWPTTQGVIAVALIVGLGTSTATFTASYDLAKAADARYAIGADIKVTPSPTSTLPHGADLAQRLAQIDGIRAATPVLFSRLNSDLRSDQNSDAASVAVIDPAAYMIVSGVDDSSVIGMPARQAFGALEEDPAGVLVNLDMAEFLSLEEEGAPVQVAVGKRAAAQALGTMNVVGFFDRLPGFSAGVDAVINSRRLPRPDADFYLASTVDQGAATLASAVAAVRAGPGSEDSLQIDSRRTALSKDQSSLAALNIHGLLTLDSSFALAMGATAMGIFVFGLMLARRREYVILRAQGMQAREIRALIVAEALGVALAGCAIGVMVGVVMAFYFVNVLRPLFVVLPSLVIPPTAVGLLAALLVAAAVATSAVGAALVNHLRPTELLRDE